MGAVGQHQQPTPGHVRLQRRDFLLAPGLVVQVRVAVRAGIVHDREHHHQVGLLQIGGGHRLAVRYQVYVKALPGEGHAQVGERGGGHVH